ncbi:unnamed protein product [Oncorhynchus mykiss]|uniref:FERM domain-containing protein n=1 Tax=Oncorhynchus mykiss TaxID=8022 RepID=A0A060XSS9_ONCMY|nr:unnamed protein product [Oncorhynchus mykiss]
MRESDRMWFPPNHILKLDESANEMLLFRVRYYFPGWYNNRASCAHRYGVNKGLESPVLDDTVMSYLFAQWRSDFVDGWVSIPVNHEAQEECLGMAVLDMMRMAKESSQAPVDIFNDTRRVHRRKMEHIEPQSKLKMYWESFGKQSGVHNGQTRWNA